MALILKHAISHAERRARQVLACRVLVCLLVTIVLAHGQTAAAADFPNTRAGEVARAYIESFNSGDAAAIAAFAAEYRSASDLAERAPEERAQRTLGLYNQLGPLELAAISGESEHSITLTVRADKVDMWLSCTFELEAQAPHRLDSVKIMPAPAPDAQVEQERIEWESMTWRDITDLLEQVRARSKTPALAAAIVEEGRILEAAVVGMREAETQNTTQNDDRFHIGSIGKSMTATMIGRLVERGTLDWSMTVGDALPDVPMHDAYRAVTLEQLLQHQAGLPGYQMFDDAEEARLNAVQGDPTERRAAFVREFLMSDPVGAVGVTAYSNAGYVLAAYIAERTSGESWEALMEQHVFVPMHLKHTGFGMPATPAHTAQPRGHVQDQGRYVATPLDAEYPFDAFIAPAGNVHASIADLAHYAAQHLNGLLGQDGAVQASTFTRLHTLLDHAAATGYASGWMIQESDYGMVHTHAGSAGTFFAMVSLYPEHRRAVVVAMNIGPEGMALAEGLTNVLMGRAVQAER